MKNENFYFVAVPKNLVNYDVLRVPENMNAEFLSAIKRFTGKFPLAVVVNGKIVLQIGSKTLLPNDLIFRSGTSIFVMSEEEAKQKYNIAPAKIEPDEFPISELNGKRGRAKKQEVVNGKIVKLKI